MQKDSKIALAFCSGMVGLLIVSFIVKNNGSTEQSRNPVTITNGIQIIDLTAKGGYSPKRIEAQAGVTTELRVSTEGTYDCSSSLIIPSLGFNKMLAPTGVETISISEEKAQGTLEGMCSMGMYRFEIAFKE